MDNNLKANLTLILISLALITGLKYAAKQQSIQAAEDINTYKPEYEYWLLDTKMDTNIVVNIPDTCPPLLQPTDYQKFTSTK